MKTIISNIHRLFLLPLLLLMSQLASGQVAISIDPASPSVNVGDAFSVVIKVSTGAQQLDGVSTFLDFDPTLINVVSVTPSATTTSAFPNVLPSPFNPGTIYFDNTIGQIAYGAGTLSVGAALGDFDFVTLDLIAVGAGNAVISFLTSPINLQTTASLGGTNFASSLSGATISIAAVNSVPVISPIGNASVNENGTIQVPLSISDADGDNLTVTITSVSNEPQELQTANAGIQVDPYPTTASGFLAQNGISSSAGAYSASLDFSPTFGDGGSNGDGNAVYTITVQVSDEDGNSITETFDLTVNDVVQTISGSGVTRIEAESFDNQGPANTFPGNSSGDTKGIGVEIAPTFTNIGFTTKGDFVEYEIDVLSAGNYDCDFFISCPNNRNGATMNVSSDGNPLGTFTVATTNGYGNYASQGMVLALPAGTQTLRFDFDWTGLASNNLFNIDYFDLTLLPPNNSPTIAAISLQEIAAGGLVTVGVSVSDDNNPAASIAIFDKSLGGTNNPFTPGTQVSPSNYTFSDNGGGSYTLTWQTALAEARSYEARVTANDGVNPPVTEVFDINVAHPVPGIFLANTISAPTPWYGNGPIAPFTVSIETAGNIGWVDNGEFIEYLIDVPSAGLYEIRLNSSNGSGVANNFFVFEEGNATALGSATVLSNGWGSFADYTIPIVLSNAGLQTLRIEFTGGTNTQEIELSVLPDLAPPVIILLGADPQDLSVGDSYTELGATASDNVDGDISANIVIDASAVNTTTPGSYPVTYNVSDAAGNAAITATRTVNVNAVAPFQLCIACGSIGLTAFGRTFEADNPVSNANQTGSHPTRTAGKKFAGYGGAIAGTSTPDELLLFQKEIFGGNTGSAGANPNFSYNIPVPNGTYAVDLYFSEVFHPSSGGRIFDVLLEGNVILDEYDLVDPIKDGISVNQTAITRTYFVNVTDGSLDVQIGPASLDNGKLSGLCVSAVSSANLMPVAAIGNLSTDALVAAAIPLGITDPEGDVLTVVLNGLPASLSYNSSSGQLEGTPLATDAGTYTINAIISDGTSSPITEEFSLVINPPAVDNPPTIAPIADVEINEGGTASVSVTVSDDNNPAASIVLYDKSIVVGSSNTTPFTSNGIVNPASYSFTDNGGGSYSLSWATTAGDGRSYLARVTADDGVNPAVTSDFTIDVAQQVPGVILAKTFANPLPWYGSSTPGAGFTVAIESNANENVGYIGNGEFVEYLVNVPAAGGYDFEIQAANGTTGSTTITLSDGSGALGSTAVPGGGSSAWQSYNPYTFPVSFATSGLQTIRLDFSGGANVKEFSFAFLSTNTAPVVTISAPADGEFVASGDPVTFTGTANDTEDGNLDASISWTSSLDGPIGTGASFSSSSLSLGLHIITASVFDLDPTTPLQGSAAISVNVVVPSPACNVSFRVNAGGASYADPTGTFLEDQAVANAGGSAAIGTPSTFYDNSLVDQTFGSLAPLVSNTTGYPDVLFQTERFSTAPTMDWAFPVANGVYDVVLLFNENWTGEASDARVFDVTIEGGLVLNDYRPSGQGGADLNVAKKEEFQVSVTDNQLNISLIKGTQNPAIKGIAICYVGALNTAPVVTITGPANAATVGRGVNVTLTGTAIDTEDGDISANLNWSTDDPQSLFAPISGVGASVDAQFARPGTTILTANVTDANGEPGTASITVEVGAPSVTIISPAAASTEASTNVTLTWSQTNVLYSFTEHYHLYVNPPDPNNLDPNTRISTASLIGQEFWNLTAVDGIVEGPNTIVILVADQFHDEFTNPEARDIVTFNVADNTPPVIMLTGADPQTILVGTTYLELGATAMDAVDGDISSSILINASAVDVNIPGTYSVTYDVSDAAGNPATQVVRTVIVEAAPSTDVFFVVNPATQTVNENDPVTVTIQVQANSQTIDAAEVHLLFDPTVLQVQSLTPLATGVLPQGLVAPAFDNLTGTIDYGAGTFSGFPSGTFDLLEITFVAVGGPTTDIDFTFTFPSTIATFNFANVLTGTTKGVVNVIENAELVITPNVFSETLPLGTGTASNSFVVSTSDALPLPGDLALVGNASWLTVNPTFDGYTVDATGLAAGVYSAIITASGTGYDDGLATVELVVEAPAVPGAFIAITPGAGLGASTFGASSIQVTNTGTIDITGISIDLSTAILPDMVWDPLGTGGDATASCFTPNVGAAITGLIAPADPCADPFSVPRQGGFDILTIGFADFNATEAFFFTADVDPNSIQGVPGAGAAGSVSGYELTGATVTVTFSDGSVLVGNIFEDGSLGGGNLTLAPAPTATPSIILQGSPGSQIIVPDVNQVVTVSGTPGDIVTLLQMDSRLFIATGAPAFNVSSTTFYANEAMSGKAVISATIGAGGTVDIPVTLFLETGAAGTPNGGKNQFIAVTTPGPYSTTAQTSGTSNVLTVVYLPGYNPAAIVKVNPGGLLDASTFVDNSFQILNTGNVEISRVSIDLSTSYLMDVVFDPVGTAGDLAAKCLIVNTVVGTPGLLVPLDPCVDPFSQPHNGVDNAEGFDIITLEFFDFNGAEQLNFSVDIDPTSIKNDLTSGDAGAISGAELIGATVTIEFADGTILTRCLFEDGSLGGSVAELTLDALPSPSISVQGIGVGPAFTSNLSQVVDIIGPPNADVVLLQWDTRLYIDAGSTTPYDIDPFEANENMAKVLYTGTLDASGFLSIPVTLLETVSINAGPDGGINHLMAVVTDTGLTSCLSNVVILEVIPACAVTSQTPVICADEAATVDLTLFEPAITTEVGTFAYATGGTPIVDPTMVSVGDGQVIDVTFSGANGCIEPLTITYTVNPLDTTNIAATTCDPLLEGVTQQLLTNQFGCDSLVITTTTLNPSDTTNLAATTCDPGLAGVTQQLLTNQFGCDSLVITTTSLITLNATVADVACNDNGTPAIMTDDYFTFTLNPTGSNLASTYTVSGGVTPSQASYGSPTVFSTAPGTAGTGDLTIAVTDEGLSLCSIDLTVLDPGTCSNAEVLTITLGSGFATTGYDVCVPVTVQNYDSIGSGQGIITWDPLVISWQGASDFGLPSIDIASFSLLSPGVLLFSYSILNPILTPDGEDLVDGDTLFRLCFTAVGATGTTSSISMSNTPIPVEFSKFVTLPPVAIPFLILDGVVEIIDPVLVEGAAISTLGDTIPNSRFDQLSPVINSVDADFYAFGIPANQTGEIKAGKVIDSDPDAGITTLDILLIKLHIFGTLPFADPYQLLAGDVNLSGTITTLDVLLIQNIIFQNLVAYPQVTGTFGLWRMVPDDYVFPDPLNPWTAPSSREYNGVVPPGLTGEDYRGLKLGDVNGSWLPSPSGLREESHGEVVMNALGTQAEPGDRILIPITTEQFKDIASFSYTLNWDPSVLQFEGLVDVTISPAYSTHLVDKGQLPLLWVDELAQGKSIPDGTTLYQLEFEVVGPMGRETGVDFGSEVTVAEAYSGQLLRYSVIGNGARINSDQKTGINDDLPEGYRLFTNSPNPFGDKTAIRFEIPQQEMVQLSIYNGLGQLVWESNDEYSPGVHEVEWNRTESSGSKVASGVYTLVFEAGGHQQSLRMAALPR